MYKLQVDYEKAEQVAHGILLDYGIRSAPVNLEQLLLDMDIDLTPYSALGEKEQEAALIYSNDGCKKYDYNLRKWVIHYNDTGHTAERSRFTIAHELGHIVLEHMAEDENAETEANHFAKCLLSPLPLVWLLCDRDGWIDPIDIADTFYISLRCAEYVAQNYVNSMSWHGDKIRNSELAKYFQEQLALAS